MVLVAQHQPGETVDVTVFRKGKTQTFEVTLADRSAQFAATNAGRSAASGEPVGPAGNDLGLEVTDLTPEIAAEVGAHGKKGVVVSEVDPGSSAAEKGIARGDVISMVGDQPVTSVDEFNAAIKQADLSKGVGLQVFRGDIARLIVLKPKAD
jgi:serine protease Do